MDQRSEIEVLGVLDEALSNVTDAAARKRILSWVLDKYGQDVDRNPLGVSAAQRTPEHIHAAPESEPAKAKRKRGKSTATTRKPRVTMQISKDLDLKPSEGSSFQQFVDEKRPGSHSDRCVVAAYYLSRVLNKDAVSLSDVFTCYKTMKWRTPADLRNTLSSIASKSRALDTSNMDAIEVTTIGENLVEHDLPRSKGKN